DARGGAGDPRPSGPLVLAAQTVEDAGGVKRQQQQNRLGRSGLRPPLVRGLAPPQRPPRLALRPLRVRRCGFEKRRSIDAFFGGVMPPRGGPSLSPLVKAEAVGRSAPKKVLAFVFSSSPLQDGRDC